ncbi:MAG: DUF1189 domain-containing protein [Aerococcus viridans]|nr:MAG: DUF1189 domain-containing protein [Aerococcus viridans]
MYVLRDLFPVNYFKSIWTPSKIWGNRHELKWWQMLIVVLFLNGLMTIPVTINYANMTNFPVTDYYPQSMHLVDQNVAENLAQLRYANGEMLVDSPQTIESDQGLVAIGASDDDVAKILASGETALVFQENQYMLVEPGAPTATVLYTKDFDLSGLDATGIQVSLSQEWLNQNRVLVVLIFSTVISAILLAMSLFLIGVAALMFYMTKGSPLTSIETFKESVNLILNAMTLPTVIAMVYGLYQFDVAMMATVQTAGLVFMLLLVMWKTRFRDGRLDEYRLLEA